MCELSILLMWFLKDHNVIQFLNLVLRSGKVTFECKWYVPIRNLRLDTKFAYQGIANFILPSPEISCMVWSNIF